MAVGAEKFSNGDGVLAGEALEVHIQMDGWETAHWQLEVHCHLSVI